MSERRTRRRMACRRPPLASPAVSSGRPKPGLNHRFMNRLSIAPYRSKMARQRFRRALAAAWLGAALWVAGSSLLPGRASASEADAVGRATHDAVRRAVQAGQLKPLAEILQIVQKTHPGRVLDVDLEQDADGRRWYEIKLLNRDSQRVELYVDAVTGAEIRKPGSVVKDIIPMAVALRIVLAHHAGIVREAELEVSARRQPVYHVLLILPDGRERTVVVDAIGGQLLDMPLFDPRALTELRPLPELLYVLEARYDGKATEAELKRDRSGRLYYEIELQLGSGRGLEVLVDARSGRLINDIDLR
ncbi:MAG: PepSY domain-containing protein [Lautropia sp.]